MLLFQNFDLVLCSFDVKMIPIPQEFPFSCYFQPTFLNTAPPRLFLCSLNQLGFKSNQLGSGTRKLQQFGFIGMKRYHKL